MVRLNETFGWGQHHISISSMVEAGGARHYILTPRLQCCGVGHSDNVHLRLLAGLKARYLLTKEGDLSGTVVQVGMCLQQKKVPQDNLRVFSCVCNNKVHVCNSAPGLHRQIDFPLQCQTLRAHALQPVRWMDGVRAWIRWGWRWNDEGAVHSSECQSLAEHKVQVFLSVFKYACHLLNLWCTWPLYLRQEPELCWHWVHVIWVYGEKGSSSVFAPTQNSSGKLLLQSLFLQA